MWNILCHYATLYTYLTQKIKRENISCKFQINTSKCLFKIILPNTMSHHGVSPYGKLTIGIIQRIHMNMIVKKSLLYQMHFNFLNENLIFSQPEKIVPSSTHIYGFSKQFKILIIFILLLLLTLEVRWCELQTNKKLFPVLNYEMSGWKFCFS